MAVSKVYATAAFEFAHENKQLPAWQQFLDRQAVIFSHEDMQKLMRTTAKTQRELLALLSEETAVGQEAMKNFLWLLADKKRLACLPEIARDFTRLHADAKNQVMATVTTVVPMSKAQQASLKKQLAKETGQEVILDCRQDSSILGGLVIHMGDKVIDRSLAGAMIELKQQLLG